MLKEAGYPFMTSGRGVCALFDFFFLLLLKVQCAMTLGAFYFSPTLLFGWDGDEC